MWIQYFLVGESEWATELWVHAEYRAYTTVYTELVYILYFLSSALWRVLATGFNMKFYKGCMK